MSKKIKFIVVTSLIAGAILYLFITKVDDGLKKDTSRQVKEEIKTLEQVYDVYTNCILPDTVPSSGLSLLELTEGDPHYNENDLPDLEKSRLLKEDTLAVKLQAMIDDRKRYIEENAVKVRK